MPVDDNQFWMACDIAITPGREGMGLNALAMHWMTGNLSAAQITSLKRAYGYRSYTGLLRHAMRSGSSDATYNLGLCHLLPDTPLQQNFKLAARYFKRSARQGHDLAKLELGLLHTDGKVDGRPNEEAAKELFEAALKGPNSTYVRGRIMRYVPEFAQLVR